MSSYSRCYFSPCLLITVCLLAVLVALMVAAMPLLLQL